MSTISETGRLSVALFGKTRRAVLSLLYCHSEEAFYLRQIARATGAGLGTLQRELKNLSDAGIVTRTIRGNQVHFQADTKCPVFLELKGLMTKTAGVADILRAALSPLGDRVVVAFIYGSVVRGAERRGSDIDVLVIGSLTFGEVVAALGETQSVLGREVNPTVYPIAEFRRKLAAGHHFLKSVSKDPKIFLVGDQHELERLAKKPLAESSRTTITSARNGLGAKGKTKERQSSISKGRSEASDQ